ncbi:MAG: asparagine synthase-related protein, partial [Pirellulaceae bacterium]
MQALSPPPRDLVCRIITPAAWGIEGRVPFLDKEFMDVAMRINPQDKMINKEHPMEKW